MQVPARQQRAVRFGPFVADLASHELRCDGCKITLQEKPFQVLTALLEQPGQLVTREELRQRLWSADTFVDFEHSINTAIKKVREALQDSGDHPRFIETLPRRGYRFIASVEEAFSSPLPSPAAVYPSPDYAFAKTPSPAESPHSPALPPPQTIGECAPGVTLGHYQVLDKIGSGGMGEVFRARDQHLDREVAIKVLRPGTLADQQSRTRFHKEAISLSRLNHPNIATIHDFDSQHGFDFLVMEFIPGVTLLEKLARGPLPEKTILSLGTQLAEGLAAAHEHGVIHRDLKPGNLRLAADGRLKILDFGMAKLRLPATSSASTESLSDSYGVHGTPPYMAPEQLLGAEMDARTDIHAAGAVLYEMATGQRPFAKLERSQLVDAILHSPPRPLSEANARLSPELQRMIRKCLEKEPENRYQSARELAIDLQRLQRETYSASSKPEALKKEFRERAVPYRRAIAVAGISLLLLLSIFAVRSWFRQVTARPPVATLASIAVLPFADLSPSHDREYFSEGLAEEILNHLTKIPNLRVSARTSAFQFKGKDEDSRVVGQKLDVADILEGSVQREQNRVRVTARLIRAEDGLGLWSESFDRELKDIFAVEDDIANAVTSALQLKLLAGPTPQKMGASGTTNAEAYESFLHARYFSHMQDKVSALKALQYANHAIESDPGYAAAYALRADVQLKAAGMVWIDLSQASEAARRDTEKAIALDPNLADGYRVLGQIYAYIESNCPAAETSMKRALELAPGDPDNLEQGALLALCLGRAQDAANLWKQELRIDPLRPDAYLLLAQAFLDLGLYDEARAALAKALDLNPNQISMIHEVEGEVYLAQGKPQEALAEMETEPPGYLRDLGETLAYQALGRRKESDAALARLIAQHSNDAAYQIAQVYGYRGEVDQAFQWLDRAYSQHDPGLMWFKTDPKLKSLRRDPRCSQVLRKLNLPE